MKTIPVALRLFSMLFLFALTIRCADVKCSIRFIVLDEAGRPVPYQVRIFRNNGDEFKGEFKSHEALVPCGAYQYELERSDVSSKFGRLRGKALLEPPGAVMLLAADPTLEITKDGVFAIDRFASPLSGRVELENGSRPDELMRISFTQVVTEKRTEAAVGRDGTFQLPTSPRGLNSVSVIRSDGTIYHRIYQFGEGVQGDFTLRFTESVKPAVLQKPEK